MSFNDRVIVLGAGPAGIGAGIALGDQAIVLDNCPNLGGLCRSIVLDGAVFDWGGHSFHTPHAAVRDLVFDSLEMFEQTRDARCYVQGEMIPYPFQKNFDQLRDPSIRSECAFGLQNANMGKGAANLEEYLGRRFGPGIARHFLLPYNRKLWGQDLKQLAVDWVEERVAGTADAGDQPNPCPGKRNPLQSDSQVAYPAQGGFGEIMRALAQRLHHLYLGQEVVHIDPLSQKLATAGGEVFHWRRIISTLPIPKLLKIINDVPPRIIEAGRLLKALPMAFVLVVIGHSVDTPIQRVYCAGPEIPAHKIAINHNSSPYLRSLPHHGIVAEVSVSSNRAGGDLEGPVVRGLQVLGLIRSLDEVRTTRTLSVPDAYPIPTLNREAVVRQLKTWLAHRGIFTVGRLGEWVYINSDEALNRGLHLGQSITQVDDDSDFSLCIPA
jgi:UDP-galactopyranose mutase